jgi:hypothetical protein
LLESLVLVYEIWILSNSMRSRSDPISKLGPKVWITRISEYFSADEWYASREVITYSLIGSNFENVERVTRKEVIFSEIISIGAILPYHLK